MNLYNVIAKAMDTDIPNPDRYFKILEHLDTHAEEVQPEEIFEYISGSNSMHDIHLGNLHLSVLFSRISAKLETLNIDSDYFINSLDSHFYIFQTEVKSLDEFLEVLEENSAEID